MEHLRGGRSTSKYADKIEKCIKQSMRTMLFHNRYGNVIPFYKHLNILPLEENIKLLQGKFVWTFLAKKQPDTITEQFSLQFNETINNNNNRKKLIIPYNGTSIAKTHHCMKDAKPGISKFLKIPTIITLLKIL